MNLKEISKKLMKGEFSNLLTMHPSDVAKILGQVPFTTSMAGFRSLPPKTQTKVFPYLDLLLQRRMIKALPKNEASFILNELTSDDRFTLYTSLKGVELSSYLELLNEK